MSGFSPSWCPPSPGNQLTLCGDKCYKETMTDARGQQTPLLSDFKPLNSCPGRWLTEKENAGESPGVWSVFGIHRDQPRVNTP